jgi:putative sigma-54 modulation protein
MDIKVNSVNFTPDKKLVSFVNDKVKKLQLFYDNITAGEVFLKLDKDQEKENKQAIIKILLPGKELLAKKQCKTFEEATDLACEALSKQVQKHKGKITE